MKSIALFFSCFCSALVFAQGRTETLNIEIERSSTVSLTATEATDTTVKAVIKSGGMDYDLAGWSGVLWYGIQGSGLAVTNTSTSYNVFTFDLPTSKIPTNGLYELQVFGVTTNRTEEWARGRMSVRLNPSKGSLPPEWTSYPSFYASLTNRLAWIEIRTNSWNEGAIKAAAAWQNTPSDTNWTWSSDGTQITLESYSGPNAVIIPDMLDGLQVTILGRQIFAYKCISSVTGGNNIKVVGESSFANCYSLTEISLPSAITLGSSSFYYCTSLTSVKTPMVETISGAFYNCVALTSVDFRRAKIITSESFSQCNSLVQIYLDSVESLGVGAFANCGALRGVYFSRNPPDTSPSPPWASIYGSGTTGVTNYVKSVTATGWTNTFGGRPVVRMPIASDKATLGTVILLGKSDGSNWTNIPAASIVGLPSGGGNVASVFGRTGTVVAVSGDYTAAQVGAYASNNPSNYTTVAAVRSMAHTNMNWTSSETNATYCISWDASAGTFKVEEILP